MASVPYQVAGVSLQAAGHETTVLLGAGLHRMVRSMHMAHVPESDPIGEASTAPLHPASSAASTMARITETPCKRWRPALWPSP